MPNLPAIVCGFDEAVTGVFSSDGNTAYILNCGPECGGKTASVQAIDVSGLPSKSLTTPTPVTLSSPIPVPGATAGLLNGSKLYVAELPEESTVPVKAF